MSLRTNLFSTGSKNIQENFMDAMPSGTVKLVEPTKILMSNNETTEEFHVFAELNHSYKDIRFAIKPEQNGNLSLFVIKPFDDSRDDDLYTITHPPAYAPLTHKNIYKPTIYSATRKFLHPNKSEGLVKETLIAYPFTFGPTLEDYAKTLNTRSDFFQHLLHLFLNIAKTCSYIEERNQEIQPQDALYRKNMPGIWDIRSDNMIVQKNGEVMFIDFCQMYSSPYHSFKELIKECLAAASKINGAQSKNIEELLVNLDLPETTKQKFSEFVNGIETTLLDFKTISKTLEELLPQLDIKSSPSPSAS